MDQEIDKKKKKKKKKKISFQGAFEAFEAGAANSHNPKQDTGHRQLMC